MTQYQSNLYDIHDFKLFLLVYNNNDNNNKEYSYV